jgi:ubiquinone/menaquinone biosynthesis C-methylase UbiE
MISPKRFKMLSTSTIKTNVVACSCCGSERSHVTARGRDYIYAGSNEYLTQAECENCGHIFLNPQPDISALPILYPSNYGTFSAKFRGGVNVLAIIKNAVNMRRFKSAVGEPAQGMRVLDIGCGNGELLRALASARPDLELYGLDWHFPADTRRDLEAAGIHLIEGALESANLQANYFDCVLMYQLIEHLWEPEAGLRKLAAALKPGGVVVVETPNTDGYDRPLFSSGTWGGYYFPRHLNLYNFERLADLLRRSGLEISRQTNLSAPIVWCYSLQASLQERFGAASKLAKLFDPRNVFALGGFAVIDTLAGMLGLKTSNQQAIGRKRQ